MANILLCTSVHIDCILEISRSKLRCTCCALACLPLCSMCILTSQSSIIWVEEHYDQFTQAIESFQHRWLSGQPQMHPMLDHFSQCLKDMRKFWDPLCADMMISSTFYFLYGNILENRADISQMKLRGPSILWPNWVRAMTGVATVISLFVFPKSACDDVSKFLQAVPEIDNWINYTNDILSYVFPFFPLDSSLRVSRYYKEDFQGETNTYVHFRATCAGKDTLDVLSDLVNETCDAYHWANGLFSTEPTLSKHFQTFIRGYMYVYSQVSLFRQLFQLTP
jgi:hypothetical protein